MKDLTGKTAFITGGASGIGLAMARAFAHEGMTVIVSDVDVARLAKAASELRAIGPEIVIVACDVSDPASVDRAAQEIAKRGNLHVLCNNAGVHVPSSIDNIQLADWRWVMDVNFMGILHGIKFLVPLLRAHGEGGHVVNTCSTAGFISGAVPGAFTPYHCSKFAAVALSEKLAAELLPHNIGVSLLCPGYVNTNLHEADTHRPEKYREPGTSSGPHRDLEVQLKAGIDVACVGARVVKAVQNNELYIFTHPHSREQIEWRYNRILAGFDQPSA